MKILPIVLWGFAGIALAYLSIKNPNLVCDPGFAHPSRSKYGSGYWRCDLALANHRHLAGACTFQFSLGHAAGLYRVHNHPDLVLVSLAGYAYSKATPGQPCKGLTVYGGNDPPNHFLFIRIANYGYRCVHLGHDGDRDCHCSNSPEV